MPASLRITGAQQLVKEHSQITFYVGMCSPGVDEHKPLLYLAYQSKPSAAKLHFI